MAFKWSDYLLLAQFIQNQEPPDREDCFTKEAMCRCTVSRAYYAAFCHARNYAHERLSYRIRYPEGNDHWGVRERLQEKKRHDESRWLGELHEWRKQCDYADSIDARVLKIMCKGSISKAQSIISRLS